MASIWQPAYPEVGQTSQRTGIADLPMELLYFIFHHASEDQKDVSACSSICRKWRDVALPHVLATLKVLHQERQDLVQFVDNRPHVPQRVHDLVFNSIPKFYEDKP
ncbi:hypothetical protein BN946_scf184569.g47 [Trametes cinnabarina]|uniref:F-box domain-containing protein n=1 Tax=Pycnoporus cinnabarinus TaxID=5643 RepID=A0A060SE02_PYCCI|nr:hypothetical protein BN946_scf184569.g47 [Trametes cinnabarina]